jgi:hypothetical protein
LHTDAAIGWPCGANPLAALYRVASKEVRRVVRALVLLLVLAVLAHVVRRVYQAMLALRVGAIPDDVDVPQVTMEPDRGWQVTRRVRSGTATINAEHPTEGVARTWTIQLRDPGAARALEQAMERAGLLARELTRT